MTILDWIQNLLHKWTKPSTETVVKRRPHRMERTLSGTANGFRFEIPIVCMASEYVRDMEFTGVVLGEDFANMFDDLKDPPGDDKHIEIFQIECIRISSQNGRLFSTWESTSTIIDGVIPISLSLEDLAKSSRSHWFVPGKKIFLGLVADVLRYPEWKESSNPETPSE